VGATTPDEIAGMIDDVRSSVAEGHAWSAAARRRTALATDRLLTRARAVARGVEEP
jgi:hypothetical protein